VKAEACTKVTKLTDEKQNGGFTSHNESPVRGHESFKNELTEFHQSLHKTVSMAKLTLRLPKWSILVRHQRFTVQRRIFRHLHRFDNHRFPFRIPDWRWTIKALRHFYA
jgi:hypothetical protein